MILGLDNYVTIDKESHRYFDADGREYMSASKFIGRFYKPFNADMIAGFSAKAEGVSKKIILDRWQSQTDEGTRKHAAIERFFKTTCILPEDEDLRPMILNVVSQYSKYHRVYNEQIVYDVENFLAGTLDLPLITTSHKASPIDIADFKNYGKGINQKEINKNGSDRNDYMLHCLDHLVNSSYNKIALQLSLYSYMLQKQTGRRIGRLFAHQINPTNPLINHRIPFPFMKHEILAMLEWHKTNPITTILKPDFENA
jgi:hypothetical protein